MKLILSPIVVLVVSLAMQTSASGQVGFKVFITDDDVTRELDLKATEGQNGQINEVSGFAIKPESVVQIYQNENLMLFTSTNEPDRIEKVKVTDQTGELIELTKVGGNEWSLQGFDDGVYLLDVIVNMPEGSKGAYETVLVVLAPNTPDLNPLQVIAQMVNIQVDVRQEVFDDDDDDDDKTGEDDLRKICAFNPADKRCSPDENGNCPPGFGTNEGGQCFPLGPCPSGFHRANDDETGRCVPEKDLQQCEDGSWAHKDDLCPTPTPTPTPTPEPTPESQSPTPEPTPEPPTEELTANCGGVPCTPTENEDSTLEGEPGSSAPGSDQEPLPPSP